MMTTLEFDPGAAAGFTAAAATVAAQVGNAARAAQSIHTALPSLGLVGQDFIAALSTKVGEHAATLTGHAGTVTGQGDKVSRYRTEITGLDQTNAGNITRTEVR